MKKQWFAWALCGALLVSSAGVAVAQPQPQNYQNNNQHSNNSHNSRNQHKRGMSERGRSEGWYRKGGHMPQQYRGNTYVVTDWRARHLRQPPRGYHWVRSDNGDFLLVAITTGIISSIIANAIANGH